MAKKNVSVKPRMTVDEFFEYLASMSHLTEVRKWLTNQDGKTCPITAVCKSKTNAQFGTDQYERAAAKIGLNPHVADNIVAAADDNCKTPITKRYRKKLLKAARLKID